jgi:hypothetical protein
LTLDWCKEIPLAPGARGLRRHRPLHQGHSLCAGDWRGDRRADHRGHGARCRFTAFRSRPISSFRSQAGCAGAIPSNACAPSIWLEPFDSTMLPTMSIWAPDTPTPPSWRQARASLAPSFVTTAKADLR